MSEVITHAPGTFCWIELGTTDQASAKAFYSRLFGWGAVDNPMGPDSVYTMLQHGGGDLGGLYELTDDQRSQGIPPHWGLYVAVESADAQAEKAKALGGTVLMDPFDVMDAGRMTIIQDPTGATFSIWEARTNIGSTALGEPGTLCWSELATRDTEKAGTFYTELFGWALKVEQMQMGPYTMFMRGEEPAGGMMQMTEEWGEIPPHWMPYFGVTDCAASAANAQDLGGSVTVPPTDIPDVGRFAVLQDPQGAVFSIIQLNNFS